MKMEIKDGFYKTHNCEKCQEPMGYEVKNQEASFDPNCRCTKRRVGVERRTKEEFLAWKNKQ